MPKTPPINAWWCPTCEQVSFERALHNRDMAHAHGWGVNGISRCPGEWTPITVHLKLAKSKPASDFPMERPPPYPADDEGRP